MKNQLKKLSLEMTIISLLIILLLFPVIISFYVKNRFENSAKTKIGNVSISVFNRSVTIRNLKAEHLGIGPTYTFTGTVGKLRFSGIYFPFWNWNGVIDLEMLEVNQAVIDIRYDPHPELKKPASGGVKLGNIQKMKLSDSRVDYINKNGDHLNSEDVNLELSPFKTNNFEKQLSYKISCSKTLFQTADSLYAISLKNLSGNTEQQQVIIDSLQVTPQFEDEEFAIRKKYQADRFDIFIPELKILLHPFNNSDTVRIEKILLPLFNLDAYRDRRVPRKKGEKFKSLQNYLAEFKHPLLIDSIIVFDGNIRYREHAEKNNETGEIDFKNISIKLSGICAGMIPLDSLLQVEFHSGFMNSGLLQGNIAFPYNSERFNCKGSLVKLAFIDVNNMSEPAAGIVFSKGWMKVMSFDFEADQHYSRGNLNIQYSDLEFSVRGQPDGDTTGFMSKVITSVSSLFVKKESKKAGESLALNGAICYEYRNDRFIFNNMWKSILTGLRSAMVKSFGSVSNAEKENPC